jgi:hypothetical protein
MGTARKKRMSGVRGLAQKEYVSCVSGFPCKVYIYSNRRDSWICVTSYLCPPARSELMECCLLMNHNYDLL